MDVGLGGWAPGWGLVRVWIRKGLRLPLVSGLGTELKGGCVAFTEVFLGFHCCIFMGALLPQTTPALVGGSFPVCPWRSDMGMEGERGRGAASDLLLIPLAYFSSPEIGFGHCISFIFFYLSGHAFLSLPEHMKYIYIYIYIYIFFFLIILFYLFIFGCIGSLLLHAGFL